MKFREQTDYVWPVQHSYLEGLKKDLGPEKPSEPGSVQLEVYSLYSWLSFSSSRRKQGRTYKDNSDDLDAYYQNSFD